MNRTVMEFVKVCVAGLRVEHVDDTMVIPTHSSNAAAHELPAEYSDQPAAAPAELTPEAAAAVSMWEASGQLRKRLEALTVPVEALIKGRVRLGKADETNRDVAQQALDTAMSVLDDVLAHVDEQTAALDSDWIDVGVQVRDQAKSEMRSRKQLSEFAAANKKHGQALFKLQKELMIKIKLLKKNQSDETN